MNWDYLTRKEFGTGGGAAGVRESWSSGRQTKQVYSSQLEAQSLMQSFFYWFAA